MALLRPCAGGTRSRATTGAAARSCHATKHQCNAVTCDGVGRLSPSALRKPYICDRRPLPGQVEHKHCRSDDCQPEVDVNKHAPRLRFTAVNQRQFGAALAWRHGKWPAKKSTTRPQSAKERWQPMDTEARQRVSVALPGTVLSQDEINEICKGLRQYAAQIRFLREVLGLRVERRPDGSPLVWRVHVESVAQSLSEAAPSSKPSPASAGPKWTK